LFEKQDEAYQQSVLPPEVRSRIAIEAAVPLGWERWVGEAGVTIGLNRFGASAPYQVIYENLGLTSQRIVAEAQALVAEPVGN
jgi:transketolase